MTTVDLYTSAVRSVPVDRDWSDAWDEEESEARWTAYEGFRCDTCHFVTVLAYGQDGCGSRDAVAIFTPDGERWSWDDWDEDVDEDGNQEPHPCESETFYPEGPMMDYAYPIGESWHDGADAGKLSDLPLALVDIDGAWFLALTGGGMDLSWEICAAFVRLGYYPPAHFASGLPRIGTMGNESADWYGPTLDAARTSLRLMVNWSTNDLEQFTDKYGV